MLFFIFISIMSTSAFFVPGSHISSSRYNRLSTIAYDPEDDPADYTPSSSDDFIMDDTRRTNNYDEMIWPGLDDLDEEDVWNCRDNKGAIAQTIDDCELVDDEDLKHFVEKYNDQWIRYYEDLHNDT